MFYHQPTQIHQSIVEDSQHSQVAKPNSKQASNPEQPDSFVPQTEQDPITGIPIISGGQPVKQAEPISTADIGIDEYKD